MTEATETAPKRVAGRWQKGESGNARGRPVKGNSHAERMRAAFAALDPQYEITFWQALLKDALAGDKDARRIIAERLEPPLRACDRAVVMEPIQGSLTEQVQAVLAQMADGKIAQTTAATLIGAIGNQARVVEIDDLARKAREHEEEIKALKAALEHTHTPAPAKSLTLGSLPQ